MIRQRIAEPRDDLISRLIARGNRTERPLSVVELATLGAHQCIGRQLARIELEVALTTLLRRIPGLRPVIPSARAEFKLNGIVLGLPSMPVVW
ncbi:cytochrome P450 [Streptomyces sp. NBC_00654]|uniref:cytochrome P450 n=1 Tax=Streptomyces sp. NBC_00654 TaxID=2975799 RepID=UPI002253774E|nr:cytochrome P450 [Streptomyces sp. NBC_00654]MCX4970139.1 cytochrome P450 [Streptomyces sp. NBC_00654]